MAGGRRTGKDRQVMRARPARRSLDPTTAAHTHRHTGAGDPPCGSPALPPVCGPRAGDLPASMAPTAASRSRNPHRNHTV
jgi:hypothetical protein